MQNHTPPISGHHSNMLFHQFCFFLTQQEDVPSHYNVNVSRHLLHEIITELLVLYVCLHLVFPLQTVESARRRQQHAPFIQVLPVAPNFT